MKESSLLTTDFVTNDVRYLFDWGAYWVAYLNDPQMNIEDQLQSNVGIRVPPIDVPYIVLRVNFPVISSNKVISILR